MDLSHPSPTDQLPSKLSARKRTTQDVCTESLPAKVHCSDTACSPSGDITSDTHRLRSFASGCRSIDEFQFLNRIEEGTYGVVFRGRDKSSGDIVALKRIKSDVDNKNGFSMTSLREITILLRMRHPNVVQVKEVVVDDLRNSVYLIMEYVEHDLKTLMGSMKETFLIGEVKTLLQQLLAAVNHLHKNWIMHRDLKTSNLLLSHKGILKVGDFGLAREYGMPARPMTPVVVTLWYRAPELLLGEKVYSTAVDIWSVGCIFAELVSSQALFKGSKAISQLHEIFKLLGTPNEQIWPGWSKLPTVKVVTFSSLPFNRLADQESLSKLTPRGIKLLNRLLTYDPVKRCTAAEALEDPFFKETPLPVDPSLFPTWPARSEMQKRAVRFDRDSAASKGRR